MYGPKIIPVDQLNHTTLNFVLFVRGLHTEAAIVWGDTLFSACFTSVVCNTMVNCVKTVVNVCCYNNIQCCDL